jgi:hypothetical protein
MKELMEYREKLVARLQEAAWEFRAACESVGDPFAKAEDGWNLRQIASHTRDVQKLVYGMRVTRTLSEENPCFEGFDADGWMAEHYNPHEPLEGILQEFADNVDELCVVLRGMPREAWSRVSAHDELGGGLTLQLWVERSLAHIEEHLDAVKKPKSD